MPKARSARSSAGRRAAARGDRSRNRGHAHVARPSVDRCSGTGGVHSRGRGRPRVARQPDGVNRQLPQLGPPRDPPVPPQSGHGEEENASDDLPVAADRLLAIIRAEVEWLVSPSTAASSGDSEQPTSEPQLPLTSATGRVRKGITMR